MRLRPTLATLEATLTEGRYVVIAEAGQVFVDEGIEIKGNHGVWGILTFSGVTVIVLGVCHWS